MTQRHHVDLRRAVLLIVLASVALGCAGPSRDPDDVTGSEVVKAYLRALEGGSRDRGWSLLHADVRHDLFADDDTRYLRLVTASDLSQFEWEITGGVWDQLDLYVAYVRVPNGGTSIPQVLRYEGGMGLLAYDPASGIGEINVVVPMLGSAGIAASGFADGLTPRTSIRGMAAAGPPLDRIVVSMEGRS